MLARHGERRTLGPKGDRPQAVPLRAELTGAAPTQGPVVNSSAPRVSRALLAEESDKYARLVARLNPQWRVVACTDGLQWILQIRRGQRNGLPRWSSRFFYRSRESLVTGCHRYAADISGDALVILLRLPKFFTQAAL